MTTFVRGQRARLADLTPALKIELVLPGPCALAGLGVDGKLLDAAYWVGGDRARSSDGALTATAEGFTVDLAALPPAVERLALVRVGAPPAKLVVKAAGTQVLEFTTAEPKAVLVAELYRKDGWRFAALDQGLGSGWPAALSFIGRPDLPPPGAAPAPPPPPPPPPPAAPPRPAGPHALQRGERFRLFELISATSWQLQLALPKGLVGLVRLVCAGIDDDERLADERFLVLDGVPGVARAPGDAIVRQGTGATVELAALPQAVTRVLVAVVVEAPATVANLAGATLTIAAGDRPIATLELAGMGAGSHAWLGSFYWKRGWCFATRAEGAPGGLSKLLEGLGRPDLAARAALPTTRTAAGRLVRGQKAPLPARTARVRLELEARATEAFDVVCLGLDELGRLPDEEFFVYPGHKRGRAIKVLGSLTGHVAEFDIDLQALPGEVASVNFAVTAEAPATLQHLARCAVSVTPAGGEPLVFSFTGAEAGSGSTVLALALYRKDDGWRVGAVAEALAGGLGGWLERAGRRDLLPAPSSTAGAVTPTFRALEQPEDAVTLDLRKAGSGRPLVVTVQSNTLGPGRPGLLGSLLGVGTQTQLELGLQYMLVSGHRGLVPALGPLVADRPPYVELDADPRNPSLAIHRPDQITYALLYARIAAGPRDFDDVTLAVTLLDQVGGEVALSFGPAEAGKRFVALATFERLADELLFTRKGLWMADLEEAERRLGMPDVSFLARRPGAGHG